MSNAPFDAHDTSTALTGHRQYSDIPPCLDEAHHLKNEWQRALEKFIAALPNGVKVISLTATPPYDAEGGEWSRYIEMCGEIDE